MKQIFLEGNGDIAVHNIDQPQVLDNGILTKTAYSLISTGTELIGVKGRRKNPNPEAAGSPLGYSNSGTIIEVGKEISGVSAGDRVGCYGSQYGFGGHSEICSINKHLFAKLPDTVSLREAAFIGLGGIAMQAVRRSERVLGEVVVVMGMGVLGQLIARILNAAGCRVYGTDMLENRLQIASNAGITALNANDNVEDIILKETDGFGADAVMICVAADTPEPLQQAFRMIRFGGRVVMVGVAKIEIDRSLFFAKEADFVISRAAGPGRYDADYERDGHDMPYPYVRWTEGRNLKEFIRLIAEKRVRVDDLITHEFPVERAAEAYDQAIAHQDETLAVMFKY